MQVGHVFFSRRNDSEKKRHYLSEEEPGKCDVYEDALIQCLAKYSSDESIPIEAMGSGVLDLTGGVGGDTGRCTGSGICSRIGSGAGGFAGGALGATSRPLPLSFLKGFGCG